MYFQKLLYNIIYRQLFPYDIVTKMKETLR